MNDFLFVVKCFCYTILIAFLVQIKIAGISIEARADELIKKSQLSVYLQDAASGGAVMLQDGYQKGKKFVMDSVGSIRSNSHESNTTKALRR